MKKSQRPAARAPEEPSRQAARLLDDWARLAQGHVATGGGCSCGAGFGHLRMQDFEQDILDYLNAKYAARAKSDVPRLLAERAGYRAGSTGSLAELLRALAEPGAVAAGETGLLLADIARSLGSFDHLHRGH